MSGEPSVTVIVEGFPLTSETFIARQVRELGACVVALTIDRESLKAVGIPDSQAVSLSAEGGALSILARSFMRRVRWRVLGQPAPCWSRRAAAGWRRVLADRRPDVVLAQYGTNGMWCMDACKSAGVPLVVHFHGYDASGMLRQKVYRRRLGKLFEQAAAVVVVSDVMRRVLEEAGCPPEKLNTIPCGVPVDEFPVGTAQADQPCRFLAVGRFVPKKAPLLTLRAFARCAEQCPDATLTMIGGGGALLDQARRWVARSEAAGRIELLGVRPIEVVRRRLLASGCFVQHSVTAPNGDMEGWPVSIAEAASSGLPIISTRHAGIAEQVVEGETGFLVDEGDWRGMADRMTELAGKPELRKDMGLAGRRHIEACGDFNLQIRKLSALLQRAAHAR